MVYKVVLLRHAESLWNLENEFTGWTDVPLTHRGLEKAEMTADLLYQKGYKFDVAHTSLLQRAIKTLWIVLEANDLMWIPVHRTWQLNERHYGALQGLNKSETVAKYGEEQVFQWRRGFDVIPPPLKKSDPRHPNKEAKYKNLDPKILPTAESLKCCIKRALPYWKKKISPDIKAGKKVLVVAHGNSLRGIVKYLDNLSEKEIVDLNIPTGIPLVYELDEKTLKPKKHYYLGDNDEIEAAIKAVKNQIKK